MYAEVSSQLNEIREAVEHASPAEGKAHDSYVIATLEEAVAAASEGNFGVGAVITDAAGHIVARGHNHVFHPHFRSDIHAEMDALNQFKDSHPEISSIAGYTLYTSLEPCPMCLTRLITSGHNRVYHAAEDTESGMVSRLGQLTPVWVELAKEQEFGPADCSPELAELALQVFLVTAEKNTDRLLQRRR